MPRPRFQIHLTTGVLVMFLAAGLLYLNLYDTSDPGWPLRVVPYYPNLSLVVINGPSTSAAGAANPFVQPPPPTLFDEILIKPLLANIAVALLFLALAALYAEHLLRQRALNGTIRPRPHPLALALFFALLIATVWLNTIEFAGHTWSEFSLPRKSPNNPSHFGWPFHFRDHGSYYPEVFYDIRSLAVTGFTLIAITGLPAFALHSLLRRRLQIHLPTAIALMLTAAACVAVNLHSSTFTITSSGITFIFCGWPKIMAQSSTKTVLVPANSGIDLFNATWRTDALLANTLIALAILSAVALLSEFLLTRRTTPREPTP